jgi:hypothetical protein
LFDEGRQNAGKALLGDPQNGEQITDRQTRIAADEMQHAMVGATESQFFEDHVSRVGEVAIREEQEILGCADLFLAQEEQVGTSGRSGLWIYSPCGALQVGHG